MTTKSELQEQINIDELSPEAKQILEIIDQIENHTAELRNKLVSELRKSKNTINLKLDEI
jgi:hypothetical protein